MRIKFQTAEAHALAYFLPLVTAEPDHFRSPLANAVARRRWALPATGDVDAESLLLSSWLRELSRGGPESAYLLQVKSPIPINRRVGRWMLASAEIAFASSSPSDLAGYLDRAGAAGDRSRTNALIGRIPRDPNDSSSFAPAQLHAIVCAALRSLPDADLPALLAHWARRGFDRTDPEVAAWTAGLPLRGPLASAHDLLIHRLAVPVDEPLTDWAMYDHAFDALPSLRGYIKRLDGFDDARDDELAPAFRWRPLRVADARFRAFEALAWLEMRRDAPEAALAILDLARMQWNTVRGLECADTPSEIEDPRVVLAAVALAQGVRSADLVRGSLVAEWLYGAIAHPQPLVRREAFIALTKRDRTLFAEGAPQQWALPFHRVEALVSDPDPIVASAAVAFWAKHPTPPDVLVARFISVLPTADETVAFAALDALPIWGRPDSVEAAAVFMD
jgi:hypothetical protein